MRTLSSCAGLVLGCLLVSVTGCAPLPGEDEESDTSSEAESERDEVAVSLMKLAAPQCTGVKKTSGAPYGLYDLPVAGSSDRCWLDIGSNSNAVKALQRALNACWYNNLAVDGDYGKKTAAAVRSVQRSLGIKDDGIYGYQTRTKMGTGFARSDTSTCASPLFAGFTESDSTADAE